MANSGRCAIPEPQESTTCRQAYVCFLFRCYSEPILDKAELAAEHPHMGSPRPELSPTARILIEGRYVAIYEPMPYGIFVVAVVYGPRDTENWLG